MNMAKQLRYPDRVRPPGVIDERIIGQEKNIKGVKLFHNKCIEVELTSHTIKYKRF